jgi:dynein heavy chain 1, cytosolic
VEADLSKAEPALIAAKKNVENISNKDLAVIKGFSAPPEMVFFALKPIYYMLTKTTMQKGKEVTWPEIKKFMQSDFIRQVQELKADDIPEKVKNFVLTEYLKSENWKMESIVRASSAAGILASWAESQLTYADILTRVDPMKKEIAQLQEEGSRLEKQAAELAHTINEL